MIIGGDESYPGNNSDPVRANVVIETWKISHDSRSFANI